MPKVAWGRLIRKIMADKGVTSQEKFAHDVGISADTVTRWLSQSPNMPSDDSRKKVARYCQVSDNRLGSMWTEQMIEEYKPYQAKTGSQPSEVREARAAYARATLRDRAKAMTRWDLRAVPPDQAPPLHFLRGEIEAILDLHETFHAQALSRLESLMLHFEELYEAALETAEKTKSDRGQ